MFANLYHCILHNQYLIQLKLSTTVRLKKMAVVERWSLVDVQV